MYWESVRSFDLAKEARQMAKFARSARLQKQLQIALIVSVTFILISSVSRPQRPLILFSGRENDLCSCMHTTAYN